MYKSSRIDDLIYYTSSRIEDLIYRSSVNQININWKK